MPIAEPSLERLRDIGLFGGLDDDVIEKLLESMTLCVIEPGAAVFKEGDSGRDMFIVLNGELEVFKRAHSGKESRVAVLGPRDWFGEMSLLDVQPRSATVRAVAPTRLLRLTADDLAALYRQNLKGYALVVMNLAREMSRRLRVVDSIFADAMAASMDRYGSRR